MQWTTDDDGVVAWLRSGPPAVPVGERCAILKRLPAAAAEALDQRHPRDSVGVDVTPAGTVWQLRRQLDGAFSVEVLDATGATAGRFSFVLPATVGRGTPEKLVWEAWTPIDELG